MLDSTFPDRDRQTRQSWLRCRQAGRQYAPVAGSHTPSTDSFRGARIGRAWDALRVISVNVGAIREVRWREEIVTTAIWNTRSTGVSRSRRQSRRRRPGRSRGARREGQGGVRLRARGLRRVARSSRRGRRARTVRREPDGRRSRSRPRAGRRAVGGRICLAGGFAAPPSLLQARHPHGRPAIPETLSGRGSHGAYLRIIREGDVGAGDAIDIVARPEHGVTLADMVAALHDRSKADALARVPGLPAFWRRVAASTR